MDKSFKTNNRDHRIDYLKALSILGVVTIHTSAAYLPNLAIGSLDWYSAVFWNVLSRSSVPIFFICSGILFLTPQKELSLHKLWSKYIFKIIIALFFWATAYEIFDLLLSIWRTDTFQTGLIKNAIFNVLTFRHHFHLYYLHITVLVYAFLPLIRRFTKSATRQEYLYVLILWFVLGILYPSILPKLTWLTGIPLQYGLNMTYSAIGYGLLGYYVHHYSQNTLFRGICLFAIGFTYTLCGTIIYSLKTNTLYTNFLEGMTLGPALMAIGLVIIIYTSITQNSNWVTLLAKSSFCIYLIHDFFITIYRACSFMLPIAAVGIPVFTILCVISSALIYQILKEIPIVRSYLI